jgi:glycerol kinase
MPYVLALDQGTTSSRAIVYDATGVARGSSQREFPQHFPQPGWVEHVPEEIWNSQLETAAAAVRNAGIDASEIAAVAITNQRETTIVWDRATGRPIANAIVWQDRRTAPFCEEVRGRGLEPMIRMKTGLLLDPYFSATKLRWVLDNVAGARERAERGHLAFGTVDSWLVFKLTGGERHVTDYSNASRTLLFNVQTLDWDDELLHVFGVPRSVLPEALPSVGRFGTVMPSLLGAPIAIAGVIGDQQAALVGQAGFTEGLAKNTYGTGSFIVMNTGERIVRSEHGLLATVAYATERGRATYALEGPIFVTGAAVQWLRDGLGIISGSNEVEDLARRVADNGGVYFVPAFAGLGAPHWDPHARGAIFGLTRGSTSAHLARAALEALAYQTYDVVRAMESDAGITLKELRVDGGAAGNDLAMQFQADMLACDVVRPRVTETTALGAAYLAGIAVGVWRDFAHVARLWREERRFMPSLSPSRRADLLAGWSKAVERTKCWDQPASIP